MVFSFLEFIRESVSDDILRDMKAFGLDKKDIDSDGYVTLYHGGKELPDRLREGEIFFMTPWYDVALDYAKMRGGEVHTLKVNPELLNWNQGTHEVEYDSGGIISNGRIVPNREFINKDKPIVKDFNEIHKKYPSINIEIFKWIYRTLNYYLYDKNLSDERALEKIKSDIEWVKNLEQENIKEYKFFKNDEFKYDSSKKLQSHLSILHNELKYSDVFKQ